MEATCAYSGVALEFERIEGSPLWRCLNGFDPAAWLPGTEYERLKKALMQRPGGKVARKMVCPYKGTTVALEEHLGMVRAAGAFSPRAAHWLTRQEALWECSWRMGRAPSFPREIKITVGDIETYNSDPAEGIGATTNEIVGKTMEVLT